MFCTKICVGLLHQTILLDFLLNVKWELQSNWKSCLLTCLWKPKLNTKWTWPKLSLFPHALSLYFELRYAILRGSVVAQIQFPFVLLVWIPFAFHLIQLPDKSIWEAANHGPGTCDHGIHVGGLDGASDSRLWFSPALACSCLGSEPVHWRALSSLLSFCLSNK